MSCSEASWTTKNSRVLLANAVSSFFRRGWKVSDWSLQRPWLAPDHWSPMIARLIARLSETPEYSLQRATFQPSATQLSNWLGARTCPFDSEKGGDRE